MINIFADKITKSLLQTIAEEKTEGIEGDFSIVQLEAPNNLGRRAALCGLDEALRIAPEGKPVIMISIMPVARLADDSRWQAAMGYPNVVFLDSLQLTNGLTPALQEAQEMKRPKDELAVELAGKKFVQDELGILAHDLYHVRNGNKDQASWAERAKKVFGDLPFEELAAKVEAGDKPQGSSFEGRYLEGVFCDVEGTLIQNGQINEQLRSELEAKSQEKPITIWTDGDIKELGSVLRHAGITWKIVPKSEFAGARVAEAYDDLSPEELNARTNIEVLNYHQVITKDNETRESGFNPEIEPVS